MLVQLQDLSDGGQSHWLGHAASPAGKDALGH